MWIERSIDLTEEEGKNSTPGWPEKWQGSVKSGFERTKNEIVSLVSREAHTW